MITIQRIREQWREAKISLVTVEPLKLIRPSDAGIGIDGVRTFNHAIPVTWGPLGPAKHTKTQSVELEKNPSNHFLV